MASFEIVVDGETHRLEADADMPLLYALRELDFKGPKFGCGLAQCGACTVIYNGVAIRACVTPLNAVTASEIQTLDGLGTEDRPHPVQAAFIAEEAAQCGYCANGWIMTAVAGLAANPNPTEDEIRTMLGGLKCRCGTHMAMLRAVRRAAAAMRGGDDGDA